ncbi:hypothetical protein RDI58_015765 [Solanum bulbocastanum]|uniref:Uncharacterized protein n=1 Tax=Solanum bulbocastanum TaxID=147425 RepID=A0AAN8YBS2_SOLBU
MKYNVLVHMLLCLGLVNGKKRQEEEKAETQLNMQLAHAKLARDLCNEVKANLLLKLSFSQSDG